MKLKWSVTVGEGHSSPAVSGKRAYVFSRQNDSEVVSAFDLTAGKLLWQDRYVAAYTVNPAARSHGQGPKSTPTVVGGRLYTLGISGILFCYDIAAGRLRWRKGFSGEFKEASPWYGVGASPVVDRGAVIAYVGGHDQGALMALDAESGVERWRWAGDGPSYASPIVVEVGGVRQVITQSQKNVVGISASDGKLLWKIPFTTEYTQNIVTPLLFNDLLILSGYGQVTVAARIEREGERWKAVEVWRNADVPMYMSSPVLSGNLLVGLTHRNRGQLFILDAATGKTLWRGEGRTADNAALVLVGGTLLVETTDGELIVASVSTKGVQPIRQYRVAESPTWAHPAPMRAGILVKDSATLALWSWK